MKKRMRFMACMTMVGMMSIASMFTAFAGEWKQDHMGWWWQEDDGSYPVACWKWIDGNQDGKSECYYFNASGYAELNMYGKSMTNADGAWIENGLVQVRIDDASKGASVGPGEALVKEVELDSDRWNDLTANTINPKYLNMIGKDISYAEEALDSQLTLWPGSDTGTGRLYTDTKGIIETLYTHSFRTWYGKINEITYTRGYDILKNSKSTYTYEELCQMLGTPYFSFESDPFYMYWWALETDENDVVLTTFKVDIVKVKNGNTKVTTGLESMK